MASKPISEMGDGELEEYRTLWLFNADENRTDPMLLGLALILANQCDAELIRRMDIKRQQEQI